MNSLHKIFEPIVLGVLPGSIGIGAGVMMDYSTPSSASISTATSERADKYLCPLGSSINYVASVNWGGGGGSQRRFTKYTLPNNKKRQGWGGGQKLPILR